MKLCQIAFLVLGVNAQQNHSAAKPLPFNYQHESGKGPLSWRYVNTTGNEWEQYVGQEDNNLDVVGNECKSRRRPSPINLVVNAECMDTHEILTRKIKDTDCKIDSMAFSVTPHTLRADFPSHDTYCQRPTIDLPNGYPHTWFAQHIEVHLRAEHVLDGRRYDGEMQMFHLGREDQKRELAAVSFLLDASGFRDDARLQEYIDRWEAGAEAADVACRRKLRPETRQAHRRVPVQDGEFFLPVLQHTFENQTEKVIKRKVDHPENDTRRLVGGYRDKMFPYDIWPTIHFYRYRGMITVPPCSEIVSWRILDEPLVISRRQLTAMARLLANYQDPETCEKATLTSHTGENVRPLQDINHEKQELVHCTSKDFTDRFYTY